MAIARVSGSHATSNAVHTGAAQTKAYGGALTKGSRLIVIVTMEGFVSGLPTVTVSDGTNGSYAQIGSYISDGSLTEIGIFSVINTGAGVTPTVTITPSNDAYLSFTLDEYTGAGALRDVQTVFRSSASTSLPSATVTALSGDLIVVGADIESTATSTVAGPFTLGDSIAGTATTESIHDAYNLNASGNLACTFTASSSSPALIIIASFAPAIVLSEAAKIADTVTASMGGGLSAAPTEAAKVADTVTPSVGFVLGESVKVADTVIVAVGLDALGPIAEAGKLAETVTPAISWATSTPAESGKLADAVSAAIDFSASVAEAGKLADTVTAILDLIATPAESLKIADTVAALKGDLAATPAESAKLAETATLTLDPERATPVGPGYAQRVLNDGPLLYWRLGETAGSTTVQDSSGNGNNGSVGAGVTLGQVGALADGDTAAKSDGTTGAISGPTLTLTRPLTMECWINQRVSQAINVRTLGMFGAGAFKLQVQSGLVAFYCSNAGGVSYASPTLPLGVWHHIVGVATAGAPGSMTLYIDGVFIATVAQSTDPTAATQFFALGVPGQNFFDGMMDEIAIYPSAFTAQQVADHYALRLSSAGSEAIKIADTVTGAVDELAVLADSLKIADVVTAQLDQIASVAETGKLADSIVAIVDLLVVLSESAKLAESPAAAVDLLATLAESAKLSESITTPAVDLLATIGESAKLAETATPSQGITIGESLKVVDAGFGIVQLLGVLHITDGPVIAALAGIVLTPAKQTDTAKLRDTVTAILDLLATASESLKIADAASPAIDVAFTPTEALRLADVPSLTLDPERATPSEAAKIADTVTASSEQPLTVTSESAKLAETAIPSLNPEQAAPAESARIADALAAARDLEATLSEAGKLAEAALVGLDVSASVSESGKLAETAFALPDASGLPAPEAAKIAEQLTLGLDLSASVAESLKAAETPLLQGDGIAAAAEMLKLAETVLAVIGQFAVLAEAAKLAETVTAARDIDATLFESAMLAESVSAAADLLAIIAEAELLAESVLASFPVRVVDEGLRLAETVQAGLSSNAAMVSPESGKLAETLTAVRDADATIAESAKLAETASVTLDPEAAALADALRPADIVTASIDLLAVLGEAARLADPVVGQVDLVVVIAELARLADVLASQISALTVIATEALRIGEQNVTFNSDPRAQPTEQLRLTDTAAGVVFSYHARIRIARVTVTLAHPETVRVITSRTIDVL